MLSRQAVTAVSRAARPAVQCRTAARASFSTAKCLKAETADPDPEMNGGYINPPAIKRAHRDPYAEWTHPQQRRNFGEPVHEDNDILGTFTLEDYTHMTPARGALMWAGFISVVLGLSLAVKATYPDRPSAPKEYADGLEAELGGPGALRAHKSGDPSP